MKIISVAAVTAGGKFILNPDTYIKNSMVFLRGFSTMVQIPFYV